MCAGQRKRLFLSVLDSPRNLRRKEGKAGRGDTKQSKQIKGKRKHVVKSGGSGESETSEFWHNLGRSGWDYFGGRGPHRRKRLAVFSPRFRTVSDYVQTGMYTRVNVCPSLFLQTPCRCIYKETSVRLSSLETRADVFPFLTVLSSKYPPSFIPPLLMPSEPNCGRLGSPPQTIKVCFLFVPSLTRPGRLRSPWPAFASWHSVVGGGETGLRSAL